MSKSTINIGETGFVVRTKINDNFTELYPNEKDYPCSPRQAGRDSILSFKPYKRANNPVLSATDITDIDNPSTVADPFIVFENGIYHLFFEVMDTDTGYGQVGHATSYDGFNWTYDQIIIDTAYHKSYPCCLKWNNIWYIVLAADDERRLELWEATTFPTIWSLVGVLSSVDETIQNDHSLFYWDEYWWLITQDQGNEEDSLLFYNTELTTDGWVLHPSSPILTKPGYGELRGSGRPIVYEDSINIFYQNRTGDVCCGGVDMYKITELTTTSISLYEVKNKFLNGSLSEQWTNGIIHHIDIAFGDASHPAIAVMDGQYTTGWGIGIYIQSADHFGFVGARIEAVAQNISQTTHTKIDMTNVYYAARRYDYGDNYDNTNNYYVIPENGIYLIHAQLCFDQTTANGEAQVTICKNGTLGSGGISLATKVKYITTDSTQSMFSLSEQRELSEGDTIELDVIQWIQASLAIVSSNNSTFMFIRKLT